MKTKCSQCFRLAMALTAGVLCGFSPTAAPPTGGIYWVEGRSAHREEIIRIHSIMKWNNRALGEVPAWELAEAISIEARRSSLDPVLILAVINVESRFDHQTTSMDGARGLMQILPFVGNHLADQTELIADWEGAKSLDDPILNVKLGIFYLGSLKKRFKDLDLALTAYNWGPTRVQSRLDEDEPIPLGYAEKVLSRYEDLRRRFGVRPPAWK